MSALRSRLPVAVCCLWALLLLAPFFYAFCFCYPYGDDYDDVTRAMFLFDLPGALYEIGREWLTWGGRYTSRFLAVFLAKAVTSPFLCGAVCATVFVSWGFAGALIGWSLRLSARRAAVFGLFCLLATAICHGQLPNFYLYTDSLTIALQAPVYICFLAFMLRLRPTRTGLRGKKGALISGALAAGMYEHAALAVLLTATLFTLNAALQCWTAGSGRRPAWPRVVEAMRPYLWLLLILFLFVLFSFLAPGNFQRMAARPVSEAQQSVQLANFWADWGRLLRDAATARWLVCVGLLCLWLGSSVNENPGHASGRPIFIPLLAICGYLAFTGALVFLHARGEAPVYVGPKTPASLVAYGAIAFGIAIFPVLQKFARASTLSPPWRIAPLALMFPLALGSPNFQGLATNSANGALLTYGKFMQTRERWLQEVAASATPAHAPPAFGLWGEILDPSARELKPQPDLPVALVQEWLQPIFPFDLMEGLKHDPGKWPNMWAARLYGLQSVAAAPPDGSLAIGLENMGDALELRVPAGLDGVTAAWLVTAPGGPNPTFLNQWLVLETPTGPIRDLAIYLPSAPTPGRLLPLPIQRALQTRLLASPNPELIWWINLAAMRIECRGGVLAYDKRMAIPLGLPNPEWPTTAVFARRGLGSLILLAPYR